MRRGQERPLRSGGAVRSRRSRRITTGTLCTVGARMASIDNEHCRSSPSSQIPGVSTRCTAMYWNGRRIVRTITTMEHRPTGRLGLPEIAVAVPFAAVPGTSLRISLARPSACGSTPSIGPALSAFGLAGRLTLEIFIRKQTGQTLLGLLGKRNYKDRDGRDKGPAMTVDC